ncbi:MAG: hypothetical protein J0L63_05465, partial [Anaerolineae bacterium]|nr:hypothetical protein [Anaerolineae bacterium]
TPHPTFSPTPSVWRIWRQWRRTLAAASHLPAPVRFLSAAIPLLLAAFAAWRQPTPYFPQPNAPTTHFPALNRHQSAPNTPLPAANNGGDHRPSKTTK